MAGRLPVGTNTLRGVRPIQQKSAPSEPGKQADQHEDSVVVTPSEAESDL
jgi:hypothetical protein